MTAPTLNYSGHLHFRHRLVLAILSGKAIKIDKIRPGDKNPGLRGMLSEYCLRDRH
jgi:RNA 3'-terminal phosphate cyclase